MGCGAAYSLLCSHKVEIHIRQASRAIRIKDATVPTAHGPAPAWSQEPPPLYVQESGVPEAGSSHDAEYPSLADAASMPHRSKAEAKRKPSTWKVKLGKQTQKPTQKQATAEPMKVGSLREKPRSNYTQLRSGGKRVSISSPAIWRKFCRIGCVWELEPIAWLGVNQNYRPMVKQISRRVMDREIRLLAKI